MDPEDRDLLQRVAELSEENHRMVKRLYRAMQWGRVFSALYWILVIGAAVGAFYFIQPYLDAIFGAYGSATEQIHNFSDLLGE